MITTSQKARLCKMEFIPESNIPILLLLVLIFGYKKSRRNLYASTTFNRI